MCDAAWAARIERMPTPAPSAPLLPAVSSGNTGAVATRVTSSRFVGRSAELADLEAALAEAAAERPSLAFVVGDSGVGKTRLLTELVTRARASGARILSGDCVELGEGELPYAPVVAALRYLAREQDPVLGELPLAVRAELATLMPELGASAGTRAEQSAEICLSVAAVSMR